MWQSSSWEAPYTPSGGSHGSHGWYQLAQLVGPQRTETCWPPRGESLWICCLRWFTSTLGHLQGIHMCTCVRAPIPPYPFILSLPHYLQSSPSPNLPSPSLPTPFILSPHSVILLFPTLSSSVSAFLFFFSPCSSLILSSPLPHPLFSLLSTKLKK